MTTPTAHEAWETLTTLRAQVATSASMLSIVRGETEIYDRLVALVKTARDAGTYEAYTTLTEAVGGRYNSRTGRHEYNNEFRVASAFYTTFHKVVFGYDNSELFDSAELIALIARKDELEALFETRNTTDQTDAMYGRRSYGTFHKPTSEKVNGSVSRQGSLGS